MRCVAALAAALVASSAAAAPQPRLALGNHRTICLDDGGAVPDALRDAAVRLLRRQLAAATRGEAVVVGSAACDAATGDVVAQLSRSGDGLALTATDGQATYRDEAAGRTGADAVALIDRFFHSLWFEPHE